MFGSTDSLSCVIIGTSLRDLIPYLSAEVVIEAAASQAFILHYIWLELCNRLLQPCSPTEVVCLHEILRVFMGLFLDTKHLTDLAWTGFIDGVQSVKGTVCSAAFWLNWECSMQRSCIAFAFPRSFSIAETILGNGRK